MPNSLGTPLDESQYELVDEASAPQDTAQSPLDAQPLDEAQLEPLPSYANGSSPKSPVNKSPVSVEDRAKLSLGNLAGNIAYLKQRYEDVQADGDDLVVKDKGVWHRVDAKGLGDSDPWETTKKIVATFHPGARLLLGGKRLTSDNVVEGAKDVADLAGTAINIGAGTAGALGGAGLASIPAAAAAGAAGEGVRSSLGRLVGTYEATPEQQIKDIGWESLMAAGGQTIALGAKPTMEVLGRALKPFAVRATNSAKETMSALLEQYTGTSRWALRRAMDKPEPVINKARAALETIGESASRMDAPGVIADKQIGIIKTFAKEADDALRTQWNRDLHTFTQAVQDSYSVNVGKGLRDMGQELTDSGWGTIVGEGDRARFRLFTDADMAYHNGTQSDMVPKIFGKETRKSMEEVERLINAYSGMGSFQGKTGAKKLLDLKRAMDESFTDLLTGADVPPSVKRVVANIRSSMDDKVGQSFANHSEDAYSAYRALNSNFSQNVDSVRMFKDAVKDGNIEPLVKKLVSKSGSNRTLKDESRVVADLMGERGHALMQDLLDWEAAKGFTDSVPASLHGNSFQTGLKAAGTVTGTASPEKWGRRIAYGNEALDFLKSLGPNGSRYFLSNDKAVSTFAQSLVQAYDGEDRDIETLLRESGVK